MHETMVINFTGNLRDTSWLRLKYMHQVYADDLWNDSKSMKFALFYIKAERKSDFYTA